MSHRIPISIALRETIQNLPRLSFRFHGTVYHFRVQGTLAKIANRRCHYEENKKTTQLLNAPIENQPSLGRELCPIIRSMAKLECLVELSRWPREPNHVRQRESETNQRLFGNCSRWNKNPIHLGRNIWQMGPSWFGFMETGHKQWFRRCWLSL